VTGNTYKSDYFGFTYTFPQEFEVDQDFMQGQEDQAKLAFVLLAAYGSSGQSDNRQGVVILADRSTDASIRTSKDYLDKMTREHFVPNGFEVVNPAREVSVAAHSFCRVDYRKGEIRQTAVASSRQGYFLVFNLVGPSAQDVEQLFASLESLKFTPPPAAQPGTTMRQKPGVQPRSVPLH
jgi:hypothetical protein